MLRGNSVDDIDELAERLFVQKIVSRIYPEMRDSSARTWTAVTPSCSVRRP